MFKKQYLPVKARFFCADRGGENVAGAHHHTRGRGCCGGGGLFVPLLTRVSLKPHLTNNLLICQFICLNGVRFWERSGVVAVPIGAHLIKRWLYFKVTSHTCYETIMLLWPSFMIYYRFTVYFILDLRNSVHNLFFIFLIACYRLWVFIC